jgi:hypothetical protein
MVEVPGMQPAPMRPRHCAEAAAHRPRLADFSGGDAVDERQAGRALLLEIVLT